MRKRFALILLLAVGCNPSVEKGSRGHLLIVGGKGKPAEAIEEMIRLTGGPILVIPSASGIPLETGPEAMELFKSHGAENVDWIFIDSPEMASADSVVALIEKSRGIFFTGGVQTRLMDRIGDTPSKQAILDLYFKRGGVIGGTSAGAAVQSEVMITGDGDFTVLEKGNIVTAPGFGFLKNCIVDQHFVKRQRNNRLLAVALETGLPGVGIDETTAILYSPDDTFQVFGEGSVIVYDPRPAKVYTGSKKLSADGVRLSVLRDGQRFDMNKGSIIP